MLKIPWQSSFKEDTFHWVPLSTQVYNWEPVGLLHRVTLWLTRTATETRLKYTVFPLTYTEKINIHWWLSSGNALSTSTFEHQTWALLA